jgi:hypothetical protein
MREMQRTYLSVLFSVQFTTPLRGLMGWALQALQDKSKRQTGQAEGEEDNAAYNTYYYSVQVHNIVYAECSVRSIISVIVRGTVRLHIPLAFYLHIRPK